MMDPLRTLMAAAALLVALPFAPAIAAYRLEAGDTLDFAVLGMPALSQRATIGADGEVSLPLIGEVRAAGATVDELRARLRDILPRKAVTVRGPDGRDTVTAVRGEEISLSVAAYRPVYLLGDVARPGEQPFRPEMTAAQAVAVAGGYDLMRYRTESPFLTAADLRGEYETLWADFARESARIGRLRAELAGKAELPPESMPQTPLAATLLGQIAKLEGEQLATRIANAARERAHLRSIVASLDDRLRVLAEQLKKEEEGAADDQAEVDRVNELFRRNVVPVTRTVETRRLSLLSATRALQVANQVELTRRERIQAVRNVDRLDEDRRVVLNAELQDATAKLANLRTRIQGVGEKLLYTGVIRSQVTRGSAGGVTIRISRRSSDRRIPMDGTEFTPLAPGDIVEVSLPLQYDPAAGSTGSTEALR